MASAATTVKICSKFQIKVRQVLQLDTTQLWQMDAERRDANRRDPDDITFS
jgi:hypothetical protein